MARLKKAVPKKKTPLLKHLRVLEKMSGNVGKKHATSLSRAMIDANYSESYARSGHITQTDSWQRTLDTVFSDDKLAAVHERLLNAKEIQVMPFHYRVSDKAMQKAIEEEGFRFIGITRFMTTAVIRFVVPNTIAQDKALDKAYKLKKKYGDITIKHKFGELSDQELEREVSGEISEALGLAEGEEEA